jgi:hypothetical protein
VTSADRQTATPPAPEEPGGLPSGVVVRELVLDHATGHFVPAPEPAVSAAFGVAATPNERMNPGAAEGETAGRDSGHSVLRPATPNEGNTEPATPNGDAAQPLDQADYAGLGNLAWEALGTSGWPTDTEGEAANPGSAA